MTTFIITLRDVFPDAAEGEVCVKYDAAVDADGVKWNLTDVVGIVAAYRQDLEPDCFPASTPVFPVDVFLLPVTGTDFDDDAAMRELLSDATWTALMQWTGVANGDPSIGLPFTVTVEYHE